MSRESVSTCLRLALPKGRMEQAVLTLLGDAGIRIRPSARSYRPEVSLPDTEAKTLKPQNIVEMLALGSRDLGFAGADWVAELEANVVELLDTGLDPVQVVAAAPQDLLENGALPARPLVVASEYERLARRWIAARGLSAEFVRSYGATEVFPPEDADVIVDNTATGATLEANGLAVVDEVMRSSTRLYANPVALADPARRRRIDDLVMLLNSVLVARRRGMLEVNASAECLDAVVAVLPSMRRATAAGMARRAGGRRPRAVAALSRGVGARSGARRTPRRGARARDRDRGRRRGDRPRVPGVSRARPHGGPSRPVFRYVRSLCRARGRNARPGAVARRPLPARRVRRSARGPHRRRRRRVAQQPDRGRCDPRSSATPRGSGSERAPRARSRVRRIRR